MEPQSPQQNQVVVELARELARAVEVNLDTYSPQSTRMEAYMACERFKEMSPLCAQVGLYLASGAHFSTYVKHFGLQLMENTVKCKWNQISQQEKLFIKENAMKLLSDGAICDDPAQGHIKDALSKIIVEMVKREWPQQWTTLLGELSDACGKGTTQTELVLLVFLRLVEDVALLQTIESNQRRKDIYQALTVNMTEIFEFFLRLIELHVTSFRTAQMTDPGTAAKHSRVVQTVLLTLTGFVEWVSIQHIVASNGKLLHFLCLLLLDPCFRIPAAECLSQILNRKGTPKERVPLAMLFQEEMIGFVYRAATQFEVGGNYEAFYQFLKKLIGVLGGLANQLTAIKASTATAVAAGVEDPFSAINKSVAFPTYLETVLLLTRHPSLTLAHGTALIWVQLLKHEQIARDEKFLEYVPKVIESIGPRILKISYPTTRPMEVTMDPAVFASLDYDGEEEFTLFFYRCRTDLLEIFRQGTLIAPLVTFAYCEQWMNVRLLKSRAERNTTCSIQDPVYLEWEALVAVIDGVMSRIVMVTERPAVSSGLRLLEECLAVETEDPLICSIILSAISALFVFLSMSSCQKTFSGVSLLPRVLDKVFSALVFTDPIAGVANNGGLPLVPLDPSKLILSKAVKNLRRHAASLMVKLAIKFPLLLLPIFEQIHSTVQGLMRPPSRLSRGEQVTLQEALLIIANHYCDYEKQTHFVSEVIQEGRELWQQVTPQIKTVEGFIKYTGLHERESNEAQEYAQHRSNITHALNIILGVIKRCSWPEDPDRAARGNFVVGLTESANPICRNPATPHFVPLLQDLLSLFRVLNELHKPEAMQQIGPVFQGMHNLLESERRVLLGAPPITVDPMDPTEKKPQTSADKMQAYLVALYENSCHLLGSSGPSLGRDLYQLNGINDALVHSVFSNLEHLPDHRLRVINRIFLKPFVYSCPPVFHNAVVVPLLSHVAPFMLNRLSVRWKYIQELYQRGQLTEDGNDDTQEVVEDMMNRLMTREWLDVLKAALVGTSGGVTSTVAELNPNGGAEMAMDHDELSMDGQSGHNLTRAAQSAMASEVISELGGKLLKNPATCQPIVLTVLR